MNAFLTGKLQSIKDSKGSPYLGVVIEGNRQLLDAGWLHLQELGLGGAVSARHARDGMDNAHITIASVAEWGGVSKYKPDAAAKIQSVIGMDVEMQCHGIGRAISPKHPHTAWYGVLTCDTMQTLRARLGFVHKDFHVTLAFEPKDVFDAPKGLASIVIPLDHFLSTETSYNAGFSPC